MRVISGNQRLVLSLCSPWDVMRCHFFSETGPFRSALPPFSPEIQPRHTHIQTHTDTNTHKQNTHKQTHTQTHTNKTHKTHKYTQTHTNTHKHKQHKHTETDKHIRTHTPPHTQPPSPSGGAAVAAPGPGRSSGNTRELPLAPRLSGTWGRRQRGAREETERLRSTCGGCGGCEGAAALRALRVLVEVQVLLQGNVDSGTCCCHLSDPSRTSEAASGLLPDAV
ncbi:uncharacterized protein LOC134564344 isoform X2 [Prinia subflava]|uniref:uncharacterized protein LOC134564344 isoform X2 n=1 Tax=Prinia subflava TaxID=208062 RepID=UPI002FE22A22